MAEVKAAEKRREDTMEARVSQMEQDREQVLHDLESMSIKAGEEKRYKICDFVDSCFSSDFPSLGRNRCVICYHQENNKTERAEGGGVGGAGQNIEFFENRCYFLPK